MKKKNPRQSDLLGVFLTQNTQNTLKTLNAEGAEDAEIYESHSHAPA